MIMLKKFKDWFSKQFYNKEVQLRERYLDIKNHDVEINGTEYFLAKAMIPGTNLYRKASLMPKRWPFTIARLMRRRMT